MKPNHLIGAVVASLPRLNSDKMRYDVLRESDT